ncbi:Abi family protein [Acholeplasma laidlawii]|uniref:Abi family protein n=1 Tax=Acholeplasma laidlawii TaxID=2148 RepID=UPI0021F7CCEC|nr:Abi family protein [Acholeplasma laidlawii]
MSKGKSINSLMKHIRDKHSVSIVGSSDKKELLSMGYYHGYKALKFIRRSSNSLGITDFNQIKALNDFDKSLKQLLYQPVMDFETALKNYVIDAVVANNNSDVDYILRHSLLNYRRFAPSSLEHKKALKKSLDLKTRIHGEIAKYYYRDNPVILHFQNSSRTLPLWAVFEIIDLGTLASFIESLDSTIRQNLAINLNIYDSTRDSLALNMINHIYCIKELRNAIAHNALVFDCRFQNYTLSYAIKQDLSIKTGINNISFNTITDYLILLVFYLKSIGTKKTKLKSIINSYENAVLALDQSLNNPSMVFRILGSDIRTKISGLKNYAR